MSSSWVMASATLGSSRSAAASAAALHGAGDDLLARAPGRRRIGPRIQQGFDLGARARRACDCRA